MSNKEQQVNEKAKQYLGYWMKVVDFADDVLVAAHDAVAVVGNVVNDAVDLAQDALFDASLKLDEYRDAVNSRVEAADEKVASASFDDAAPVQDKVKPVKPTADMSRKEKIDFIIQGYGLSNTADQREVLNASSDAALTQAVDIIKRRNQQ